MLGNIILIALCIQAGLGVEFHLEKKLNMGQLTNNVSYIKVLDNNYIQIKKESANPYKSSITILNNTDFSQKVMQLDTTSSQTKVLKDNIIIKNNGKELTIQYLTNKQKLISTGNIYGDSLAKADFWISSLKLSCPTLNKINTITSEVTSHVYEEGKNCTFDYSGFVKQISDTQIAYAARYNLYILDKETLTIKQKLVQTNRFQGTDFQYMDIFNDEISNNKTILLSCASNHELFAFNKGERVYQPVARFYNPTSNIKLTAPNEGLSFYKNKLYRWKNMRESILFSNFVAEDQYIGSSYVQAILKNSNMFVTTSSFSNKTTFYNYNLTDFQFSSAFQLQIEQNAFVANSGQVCSDQKYVFIRTSGFANFTGVTVVDVENRNSKMLKNADNSTKANCSSFILIKCDYLITICNVLSANTTSNAQKNYEIQLRNMTTLQIIDSYRLEQPIDIPIKLLRSEQYGEYFAVLTKSNSDEYNDDCLTTMYKISQAKILKTEIKSTFLSFKNSRSSKSYIASFKSETSRYDQYLKLFKISDLQIDQKYYYDEILYTYEPLSIYSSDNYFVLQNLNDLYRNDVYDFSLPKGSRYLGSFYRQYYQKSLDSQGTTYFIIDGKLWIFNMASVGTERPLSIVYNIQNPAVYQIRKMSQEEYQPKSYLYITQKEQKHHSQCPIAFYIVDKMLYKFVDCEPYKDVEVYPLDPLQQLPFIKQAQILLSSDQQHIVLIYFITSTNFQMEVRNIDQPIIKVFSYKSKQQIYYADYNIRQQAVLQIQNNIKVIKNGINATVSEYGLDNFDVFDVSQSKCIVFAGKDNLSNQFKLFFKTSTASGQSFLVVNPQKIAYLKLENNCQYFGTYLANSVIQIYKIQKTGLTKLSQKYVEQVKSLSFTKYNKIVVQQASNLLVFDLDLRDSYNSQIGLQHSQKQAFLSVKYDVSYDGELFAQSYDGRTLEINNISTQQKVGRIVIQEPTIITGLSFLQNRSIYISTNQSQLYLLEASPCPSRFVNVDSICGCGTNATLIVDQCKCKANFQLVNDRCVCPSQFQFSKLYACQCGLNSIQKGTQCVCLMNFKKVGTQCVCPESFSNPKKEVCECNGIIDKNVCVPCDFPCEQCTAPGFNCLTYQVAFYLIIGGVVLIVVIIVALIIFLVRRRKRQKIGSQSEQILNQETQITKSFKQKESN